MHACLQRPWARPADARSFQPFSRSATAGVAALSSRGVCRPPQQRRACLPIPSFPQFSCCPAWTAWTPMALIPQVGPHRSAAAARGPFTLRSTCRRLISSGCCGSPRLGLPMGGLLRLGLSSRWAPPSRRYPGLCPPPALPASPPFAAASASGTASPPFSPNCGRGTSPPHSKTTPAADTSRRPPHSSVALIVGVAPQPPRSSAAATADVNPQPRTAAQHECACLQQRSSATPSAGVASQPPRTCAALMAGAASPAQRRISVTGVASLPLRTSTTPAMGVAPQPPPSSAAPVPGAAVQLPPARA